MLKFLTVCSLIVSSAALIICTLERVGRSRFPLADLIRDRFPQSGILDRPARLGFAAGTTVVVVPVAMVTWRGWIRWETAGNLSPSFWGLVALSLMVKILWAGFEELIFRGAVLPQAAKRSTLAAGLLISAVAFAFAHSGRGALSMIIYLVDGLGFGMAYVTTRSLWLPTIWHMTKNIWIWLLFSESSIQFTHGLLRIEYVGPKVWNGTEWQTDWIEMLVLIITSLAVMIVFWLTRRGLKENAQWVRTE